MLKKKIVLLAAALAVVASAPPVVAQIPVARVVIDDTDPAGYCRYIGTSPCAAVAVDATTGDLTFTSGTCGAEAATTTFECPISLPNGGIIDVSNAACNTIGKVLDIVNASTDWRCQPYAALRADSSNDTLNALAATQATGANGVALFFDTSVFLSTTAVVAPPHRAGYKYLAPGTSPTFYRKPWATTQAKLYGAAATSTYASGTSNLFVYSVDRTQAASGAETVTTLWGPTAGGATTVAKVFGTCDTPATGCDTAWGPFGLSALPGQQLLVRLTNSAAQASVTLAVSGEFGLFGMERP
jgi:hypothetical protein